MPPPLATLVRGSSATLVGIPVDCSINVSKQCNKAPPPVMTIPSCDMSAANSGGDSSRAVLTDLTIADV